MQTKAGVRYTRNGNFQPERARASWSTRRAIWCKARTAPSSLPSGKLTISPDGTVSVDGAMVAKLKVVDFAPGTAILPEGNTDFTAPAGSAAPAPRRRCAKECWNPPTATRSSSAVALIDLQRNAEMMQRALSIFNTDFNQTAVQELPKV